MNETLNKEEIDFLDEVNQVNQDEGYGILRKILGSHEIKIANRLVKMGYLDKGIADDKRGGVAYFITTAGSLYLKNKNKKMENYIKNLNEWAKIHEAKLNMSAVHDEFDDIEDGAGWATDDYCMEQIIGLSDREIYELMLLLADNGMLFDQDKLTKSELVNDSKPKRGLMSSVDVNKKWGHLRK